MLAYFLALHTALTAIPRYLLPIEPVWWLFSVFALVAIFARSGAAQKAQGVQTHPAQSPT